MPLSRLRHPKILLVALATLFLLCPSLSFAQPKADAGPSPDSWAAQIDALARWLEQQHRKGSGCSERCFTLDRLRLSGRVGDGPLKFELSGSVLADGPVAIPLFGPPPHARIEAPKEDGHDAVIGFEGDHYFLFTAARHFTLTGALVLDGDLALTIPGPLNSFEADVTAGAVLEGSRLSGLAGATLHLSREGVAQASGPTVFQLSRAVRVGREIAFEYRLVMRSGADLGVVRLKLPFGEKVLDVTGSTGFRVEGGELVLPTSGRRAEMTITGTLPTIGAFSPDPRSPYEWWLLESDAEHRIMVAGDAPQLDSAESPIPRTQASSRLFLVQRGQRIEATVQPLTSVDVLAAVIRQHRRTVVLTPRGDLVSDDDLSYENNGIDYLLYAPSGRPIYLATGGKAERIMRQGKEGKDVLVPLRTGSHSVRIQALAETLLATFGGRLDVPMPSYPLTASRVDMTLGVPARVFPLALLGGDRSVWLLDLGDLFAVMLGVVVAWIAVRTDPPISTVKARAVRFVAAAVLGGLWFLSGAVFVTVILVLVATGILALLARFLRGGKLVAAVIPLVALVGIGALIALASFSTRSAPDYASRADVTVSQSIQGTAESSKEQAQRKMPEGRLGNAVAQMAVGGVIEGVTPVALTLPSYARTVSASRELVTRDRPFQPVLFYVTEWTLVPLGVLWLVLAAVVVYTQRRVFGEGRTWIRDRMTPKDPSTASRT